MLARKLEALPETAAAFGAGEISRHHAEVDRRAHDAERATMLEGIEAEFAALGPVDRTRRRSATRSSGSPDAFDGDGGATDDARHHALNKVTLSATLDGRGVFNGSLDPELSRLAACAFDAEMYALKQTGDTRGLPNGAPKPSKRCAAALSIITTTAPPAGADIPT